MVTKDDDERLRTDLALLQEGMIKPLARHEILNPELYAQKQVKQTRYTEKALLSASTCVYAHGDQSVEIVHKGDTRPLLLARDDATRLASIRASDDERKHERQAEAKKRSGDLFVEAGRFEAALATYADALRVLEDASVDLAVKLRLGMSNAALKAGDAARAEAEAEAGLALAPDSDAPRFRRALARLVQRKWLLAEADLVACGQTPNVVAVLEKLRTKAAEAGVTLKEGDK